MSSNQDQARHGNGRWAEQAHDEAAGVTLTEPANGFEREWEAAMERQRQVRAERNEAMARSFRDAGANVVEIVQVAHGYCAATGERSDAFAAAQVMIGSFAGDPEAGCPTITVEQTQRPRIQDRKVRETVGQLGTGDDRFDDEVWETTMQARNRDTSGLDDAQRLARTEAMQAAWEQAEDAKSKGWIEKVEIVFERPEPDSFRTLVKVDGGVVGDRTWTAQR
jgi:hypothetical protein